MANLNQISKINEKLDLRKIEDVPEPYRKIFANYPHFNFIQSAVYNDVFYSDDSVVVSAPTGSGKTIIFELAVVKLLLDHETWNNKEYKIIYISPTKALCEERLVDWHKKFSPFNVSCLCVTGDNPVVDFSNLINTNLIITTPEKWDSLTRRWRDNERIVRAVKLFMIDEIHLLNDDTRGSTLEAIVTRMKTVYLTTNRMNLENRIRFIGVSATISNPDDMAEWFGISGESAKYFKFDDSMRPVKLQKIVQGYPYNPSMSSPFKFDIMLSYKLHSVLLHYSAGKPSLIFCSTRKSVEMTCKQLVQNLTIGLTPERKVMLSEAANNLDDSKLKEVLTQGIACHHAGMLPGDRRIVENLFREGNLPVLVTTSTLAMGVNLPAHLVVIKSTKYYANGEYKDYNESMLFQMIGRAGRPQFDNSATAVIMTTAADKSKYENMVSGEQPVESSLHKSLAEHVNAEVVLRTITDLGIAMQWLSSTFLYIRARKNPKHYSLPIGLSNVQLDKRLLDMCQIEINKLTRAGMLTIDQNVSISPTPTGYLMARYCVALETMKLFTQVTGKEGLQQILGLISKCREFSDIRLRTNDKRPLNILNQNRDKKTIRFQLSGKIKTLDMKINCVIQAVLGSLEILETSLIVEAQRIMRIGERLLNCLSDYLGDKEKCYAALLSSVTLAKCFHVRIWENSPYVSKQLEGIGVALSNLLVSAGKTTFADIVDSNPRDLERIMGKKPPVGNRIQDQVRTLPRYGLTAKEVILDDGRVTVEVTIVLQNRSVFDKDITVNPDSVMSLVIGDSENNLLRHEKYTHMFMIENVEIVRNVDVTTTFEHDIIINFISEDWVGIDVQTIVKLFKSDETSDTKPVENSEAIDKAPQQLPDSTIGNARPCLKSRKKDKLKKSNMLQQLMDQYFKKVKVTKETKAITRRRSNGQIKRKLNPTLTSESKPTKENKGAAVTPYAPDTSPKPTKICFNEDQVIPVDGKEEVSKSAITNGTSDLVDEKEPVCEGVKIKVPMPIAVDKNALEGDIHKDMKEITTLNDHNDKGNSLVGDILKKSMKSYNERLSERFKIVQNNQNHLNNTNNSDIIPPTPMSSVLKLKSNRINKSELKDTIKQRKHERVLTKIEASDGNPNDTIKADFSQFAKQSKKKLLNGKALESDCKKIRLENLPTEMNQSDSKTLTWSSPLVVSPKLRFSPFQKGTSKTLETQDNDNDNHNKNNDIKRKLPSLQDKIKVFGISDKDCNIKRKELHLTDIVSESFLESLGIKTKSQTFFANDSLLTNIAIPLEGDDAKNTKFDLNQTVSSTSSGSTSALRMAKITKAIDSKSYYAQILKETENKRRPQLKCASSQTEDEAFGVAKRVDSDGDGEIDQNKQKPEREKEGSVGNVIPEELRRNLFDDREYLVKEEQVQKFGRSSCGNKPWEDMFQDAVTEKEEFSKHAQLLPEESKDIQKLDSSLLRNESWEEAFLDSEPTFENSGNEISNHLNPNASFQVTDERNQRETFFPKDVDIHDGINARIWNKSSQNLTISPNQNKIHDQGMAFNNTKMPRRISRNNCFSSQNRDKDYGHPGNYDVTRALRDQRSSHKEYRNWHGANSIEEFLTNIHDLSFANQSKWQDQHQNMSNYEMFNTNLPRNLTNRSQHPQLLENNYPCAATFNDLTECSSNRFNAEKRNSNDYSNLFGINNRNSDKTNFHREMFPENMNSFQNQQHLQHRNRPQSVNDIAEMSRNYNGTDMRYSNSRNVNSFNSNLPPRRSTPLSSYENINNSCSFNPIGKTGHFNDISGAVDEIDCFDIDRNMTFQQSYFDTVDKRDHCNSINRMQHPDEARFYSLDDYPVREPFPQNNPQIASCFGTNCMMGCAPASNMNMNFVPQAFHKNLFCQGDKENTQNIRYKNTQPFVNYDLNNIDNNSNYKQQPRLSRYFNHYPKQQTLDINRQLLNLNHTITSESQYHLNDN